MWSRNGKELFCHTVRPPIGDLNVVAVQTSPGRPDFVVGPVVRALDAASWRGGQFGRPWDISPDGQRFLVIKPVGANTTERPTITMHTHWIDELKARAGEK